MIFNIQCQLWSGGMEEGIFTGYINSDKIEYENARKVINGSDQKKLIASFAEKFQSILEKTSTAPKDF